MSKTAEGIGGVRAPLCGKNDAVTCWERERTVVGERNKFEIKVGKNWNRAFYFVPLHRGSGTIARTIPKTTHTNLLTNHQRHTVIKAKLFYRTSQDTVNNEKTLGKFYDRLAHTETLWGLEQQAEHIM